MMIWIPGRITAQNFTNGDFETSGTCDPDECNDDNVTCIDDWWGFDHGSTNHPIWFSYECMLPYYGFDEDYIEGCQLGKRGIWLQTGTFGDNVPPDQPNRVATVNPLYQANPNAVYQLNFQFLNLQSMADFYVQVWGANWPNISSGQATFIKATPNKIENEPNGCLSLSIVFDHSTTSCLLTPTGADITSFQYLLFALSTTDSPAGGSGGGEEEPEPIAEVRGVLDNVSICKLMEIVVHDDCQNPCASILYDQACSMMECGENECGMQMVILHNEQEVGEYEYSGPWADQMECFELPENAEELDFFLVATHAEIETPYQLCFSYEFDDCSEIDITANTTWTTFNVPNNGRFKTVTVKSGYTLTIEDDLEIRFCETGHLIIEPNATVQLYGKLTSNCPMGWDGVIVQGDNSENQFYDSGIQGYHQGRLFMHPHSMIENALTAVRLYGPDVEDAGGQIYAEEAVFLNNSRGIVFYPYTNYVLFGSVQSKPRPYGSLIEGCTFLVDPQYLLTTPFQSHIFLWGVDDVSILGSIFSNTQFLSEAVSVFEYGMGIHAVDAGFRVEEWIYGAGQDRQPSFFDGFGTAISSFRIMENKPFIVHKSSFDRNFYGISLLGVSGFTILENQFIFNDVPDSEIRNDQIGVHLRGPFLMMNIQENSFEQTGNTLENAIGIIAENLGDRSLAIRRNVFEGMTVGNEAFGDNAMNGGRAPTGLRYICNVNSDVEATDFYVLEESVYGQNKIREIQDDLRPDGPIIYVTGAGNSFSGSVSVPHDDIANYGNDLIQYFYDPISPNEEPLDYFGLHSKREAEDNFCRNELYRVPQLESNEIAARKHDYWNLLDSIEIAIAQIDSLKEQYSTIQRDSALAEIIEYVLYDTSSVDNRDSLRLWLALGASVAADLWLAGDLIATGEHQSADDLLDSILVRYELSLDQEVDIENLRNVYELLVSKTILQLDSLERVELCLIAEASGVSAAVARGILSLLDTLYTPVYYVPGDIEPRSCKTTTLVQKFISPQYIIPNPALNQVRLNLGMELIESVELTIMDAAGKIKHSQIVTDESVVIDINNWPLGLYVYTIQLKDGVIKSGSFLKL